MKSFILRFLTAWVSYQAGESLIAAMIPDPMGPPSIRGIIDYTFNYQHYDSNRIGVLVFMSALLVLADRIGPKRIHIVWFVFLSAFCGGYNYVMGVWGYFDDIDNNMYLYLRSVSPKVIADIAGTAFFLVWFFPAILLAIIKLAGSPKFRARFAFGGSKA